MKDMSHDKAPRTVRKNLTFWSPVLHRAQKLMEARAISELSELLATLIREDYERRVETSAVTPLPASISSGGSPVPRRGRIPSSANAAASDSPDSGITSQPTSSVLEAAIQAGGRQVKRDRRRRVA
jgi:hypothetical protein